MSKKKENETKLTPEEIRDIEYRITAALNRLYDESPFYYHFLAKLPKKFDFKLPAVGAVAMERVSKRIKLLINPNKTDYFNVADFKALLQHESLHICFEHLLDEKIKTRRTAMDCNRAQDYVINDHIPEITHRYGRIKENLTKARQEFATLFNGEFGSKLTGHPDEIEKFMNEMKAEEYDKVRPQLEEIIKKYQQIEPATFWCTRPAIEHMPEVQNLDFKQTTSEELYNILFKKKNRESDGDGEGDGSKQRMKIKISMGENEDGHENMEGTGNEPMEIDDITAEEIKKAIKDAANEALETQKNLGNMPGNLSARIFEMLKSKTNYLQVINAFATSVRDSDAIRTWTKQHRKYPNQTPGRKREFKPHVVMILDSSGSMWSDKTGTLMASEIKALKDVCDAVTLVVGDTKECYRLNLKDKDFDITKFKLEGGGGTHLQFGWDCAREVKADGVICHTDGYICEIDDYNIPSLFFIYPGGHEWHPEKYKNLMIEDCL
jgi:predicted metal-dependent peptidase